MKKSLLTLAACALVAAASAEGYQVNMQSTKQSAMAHVGVAQKLGAESQHFNPAAMAAMETKFDASVGASAIYAYTSFTNAVDGVETKNDVGVSTPLYAYLSYKLSDKFAAGLSLTTPYGSSLDWADSWAGDGLVQSISLQTFSFQPTIAYQVCERLSLGAGLIMSWGDVELSRNLDTSDFVNVALSGKSNLAYGYNLGLMYDITDRLTFGASYRSKMKLKVDSGDLAIGGANSTLLAGLVGKEMLPSDLVTTFSSQMPMPANLTLGLSYQMNDRLLLAFDFQQTFWNAYESLDIALHAPIFGRNELLSPKNYHNSFALRLGAEYVACEKLELRTGVYYDQTPILSTNLNPETPGMDKLGFCFGASYHMAERLSLDLAIAYVAGLTRNGSITYETVDSAAMKPTKLVLEGEYKTSAITPTLGLSYSF